MRLCTPTTLLALGFATSVAGTCTPRSNIKCPIIFDGRVPLNTTLSTFDTTSSPFSPQYVKGENLTWSSILLLPSIPEKSRFDDFKIHRPLEVTINDSSLFRPSNGKSQIGFRRAGLLLRDDKNPVGNDSADAGIVTFHWSIRQDPSRGLNLSHEYMNVWHERADYAGNQFTFVGGVVLKQDGGDEIDTPEERNTWKVQDRNNKVVFRTPILGDTWQNFGVRLDYGNQTLQVLYSAGIEPSRFVTEPLTNDNSGGGQLQIGIAKKPTETESVVYDGYQEHIDGSEGQVYGGIFVEDNSDGCASL